LQIVREFDEPAVVAVKHMNPCGVGVGASIYEAYRKAHDADPTSIFGGIAAANGTIDKDTAQLLGEIFLEIVIAPDFTPEALEILQRKKNIRLLRLAALAANRADAAPGETGAAALASANFLLTSVEGGLLAQDSDRLRLT